MHTFAMIVTKGAIPIGATSIFNLKVIISLYVTLPIAVIYMPTVHTTWMVVTFVSTVLYVIVLIRVHGKRRSTPFDSSYLRLLVGVVV